MEEARVVMDHVESCTLVFGRVFDDKLTSQHCTIRYTTSILVVQEQFCLFIGAMKLFT